MVIEVNKRNSKILIKEIAKYIHENSFDLFCMGGGELNQTESKIIKELGLENKVIQKNVTDNELRDFTKIQSFIFRLLLIKDLESQSLKL